MDGYLLEVLLGCNFAMLAYIGQRVISQVDSVQVNIQALASSHGERLTILETKAEIIKQRVAHGAG